MRYSIKVASFLFASVILLHSLTQGNFNHRGFTFKATRTEVNLVDDEPITLICTCEVNDCLYPPYITFVGNGPKPWYEGTQQDNLTDYSARFTFTPKKNNGRLEFSCNIGEYNVTTFIEATGKKSLNSLFNIIF
ncbi:uncharacterized protein [Antedon mediterranea]|uniref:uncharacterized protein n=1 Tax=Antedon mediterranea TaxID=105859 RepID=UPI003AF8473F